MTGNADRAQHYIDRMMAGETLFFRPATVPRIVSTRACIHCGKPYTLTIQYSLCVPGARDLCDDCLAKGV